MIDIKEYENTIQMVECLCFMSVMPDKSVNLICTDPPYRFLSKSVGSDFTIRKKRSLFVRVRNTIGCDYNPKEFLEACKRICKPFNGYFFTNKNLLVEYIQFAQENKYHFDIIVYAKTNPAPLFSTHYLNDKEFCVYMREKGAIYNNKLKYQKYYTVKKYNCVQDVHPTQKPLELIKELIEISSKPGDLVFDPYVGSGTTCLAAIDLKRNYLGCEILKEYFDMCNKRIKNHVKQQLMFGD